MQPLLFDQVERCEVAGFVRVRRVDLPGRFGQTAFLEHVPRFVRGDGVLFARLRDSLDWHAARREMYERVVDVPRLLAACEARDPVLYEVSALLSARYGRPVDRIAAALYRDGRDSVAYHGDKMGDLVHDCIVAILSLRGPRRLRVRPQAGVVGPRLSFDLGFGDLLVMGGSCQRDYEHGVPKVSAASPRMSLMFRSS